MNSLVGFSSLVIKQIYDTSTDNLVEDFFEPLLRKSKTYDRGVGFFSSGWLKVNSKGFSEFASNGGHARWVTSPILTEHDWENMCLGNEARQNELLYSILSNSIIDLQNSLAHDELSALAWLIADNIIDFKLALPRNQLSGEFHDKFGIFTDVEDNKVAFSGSYNDSIQGLRNYESITAFCSWDESSRAIVEAEQLRFNKLWQDEDPNVRVFDIPQSIKNKITNLRKTPRPYERVNTQADRFVTLPNPVHPSIPINLSIRDYQEEAVKAWFDNSTLGFFEMATGTGKTITSLLAAIQFYELHQKIALVITCPYKHLVDQWEDEVRKFNFLPIKAYEAFSAWSNDFGNKIMAYNHDDIDHLCVITTNTTFMTDRFHSLIKKIDGPTMLIADEAHHFGSEKSKLFFPENIHSRLALSATPNRWFDEEGTAALTNYFGKTVYSFPLNRAIEEGFLTQYSYYPVPVNLTEIEMETYSDLTSKIVPLFAKKNKSETEEKRLTSLLLKRADVLKNAENKIVELKKVLLTIERLDHAIFYCAPAQREKILQILGVEKRIRTHQFTYREDNNLRQDILTQFDKGFIQAIVAIKCLDEGVDVPSSRMAFFLANSTNPREFVQRRGRVLRRSEGKTSASLYDFLTIPPLSSKENDYDLTRSILRKELSRFDEFAKNSLTYHSAYDVIWKIARSFDLLDF